MQRSEAYLPMPPSWPEVYMIYRLPSDRNRSGSEMGLYHYLKIIFLVIKSLFPKFPGIGKKIVIFSVVNSGWQKMGVCYIITLCPF